MSTITITIWLVLTLLLGILSVLAIWSRKPSRARGWSVAVFLLASPVAAGALAMALGWPVPMLAAKTGDHAILGVKMIVGEGIYLLLDPIGGQGQPRYYWVPWSRELAEEIQKALEDEETGEEGDVVITIPPFEWSWNRTPMPWNLPQPRWLPDKIPQEEPPQRWDST